MIDIPLLLHKKACKVAQERLMQLRITCAPNATRETFDALVSTITEPLQLAQSNDLLDRRSLEKLRRRLT